MRKWSIGWGCVLLGLVVPLVGCTNEEEDQQSLREALARLPRDTSSAVVEEEEVVPVDSSLFGFPDTGSASLPDTAGILDVVPFDASQQEPEEVDRDTIPDGLRPGPPVDTEPWIPEREGPPLTPEWTAEPRVETREGSGMTVLESVRTARNDGYDRIVFEFDDGRIPGYRVEVVELPVRQCGSGQVVPLRGENWLRVRLEPSQAHDERGRPTVRDRTRSTDLPVLREVQLICDYEGQVEWVLGLSAEPLFRVVELSSPSRLVVDVRRGGGGE